MNYKYICPVCGSTWASDSFNRNPCPTCHYWYSICTYTDNDIVINAEEYQQIISNVEQGIRFNVVCEDCGKTGRLYFDKWCRCSCGGSMVKVVNLQEYIDRLKEYINKKKFTQQQMADKLKISRSHLTNILSGHKKIPLTIVKFIEKYA